MLNDVGNYSSKTGSAATLHGKKQGFVLRLPPQNKARATLMQPFQCDPQPQLQETHRTTHTGTTIVAKHIERTKRPQPQPPHTRGTFHRRLKPLYTEKHKVLCSGFLPKTKPIQHSCSHYNAFCSMTWLTRMHLRTWQHQMTTIMQPFQCDLQPQIQETHRTTHTGTTTRCRTQRRNRLNSKRSKPHPPHTRSTFHRRLQPLYTEKHKRFRAPASSPTHHFPSSPLPFIITSLPHHSPSSSLPFFTTSLPHHFPSSPLPFVTTSHRHHSPSSSLPFFTTSLPHHFPSSPLPFLTTSLPHHFPSSPLPIVTTSLPHHFPSSPLPAITTSLPHHFPSSPLPKVTTLPSSPLPFLTTSLRHHFPSSPLPIVPTSLPHHSPSSPLPFVTTSLPHHVPR